MNKKQYRIASEVREQILKRVKEDGVPVKQAAHEHGISDQTIYGWLGKGARGAPSFSEFTRLAKERRDLLALVGELTVKLSQSQKKS